MTTRNKQIAVKLGKSTHRVMEIRKLNEGESVELLRKDFEEDDKDAYMGSQDDLSELSSRLGHLPFALVQAAALIQTNSISISHYPGLLNQSDKNMIDLHYRNLDTVSQDPESI